MTGARSAHTNRSMSTQYAIMPQHRFIAGLMVAQAVSLAVMGALHISGTVHPASGVEFRAGVSEVVISVVMLWGASSMARRGAAGYKVALGTTLFAIAGFIFGLTITIRSGYIPDITYHVIVLPTLFVSLVLIWRAGRGGAGAGHGAVDQTSARLR